MPLGIYIYIRPFSSIELACAVRQPSQCVRALCESGVLFHMSHLKLHFALHTPHFTLPTALFPLHTPHFTLHSPHFTLETSQSTLHTSHFSLPFSHSTTTTTATTTTTTPLLLLRNLHAPCASQASACVLCAKLLQCCCPRCNANTFLTLHIALFTPHTPHFTLGLHLNSSHLSSSHLIPCLPICQLISS